VVNDSKLYVEPGEELDFFTIMMRAQLRGEICCGYQEATSTTINPRNKSEKRTWGDCDLIVVGSATGPKTLDDKTSGKVNANESRRGSKAQDDLVAKAEEAAASKTTKRKAKAYNLETITKKQYTTLEAKLGNMESELAELTEALATAFA